MGQTYGRQVLGQTGTGNQLSADGAPEWLTGGATINWGAIPAVAVDTDDGSGNICKAGDKFLPVGTVLVQQDDGYWATFDTAETATTTAASSAVGALTITLTSAANVYPGDSLLVDVAGQAETLLVASVAGAVVTFTTPATKTHASGVAVSKPDTGRQELSRDGVGLLNVTILESGPFNLGSGPTGVTGLITGGKVWLARLKVGGADQPTLAALQAALPRLITVQL